MGEILHLGDLFSEVHIKRDLQGQMKMNETLDQYYDLVEVYKELDEYDQEMIWSIIQIVKKINEKKKIEQKRVD